jgi:hypothetical protein
MNVIMRPTLLIFVMAIALLGCVSNQQTWYEERCERIGFKSGTSDFNDCIARDRAWIKENRRRASEGIGP